MCLSASQRALLRNSARGLQLARAPIWNGMQQHAAALNWPGRRQPFLQPARGPPPQHAPPGRFMAIAAAHTVTEAPQVAAHSTSDAAGQPPLRTVVLDVQGMKCGGCSAAVKRMLLQQPGVVGAAVNLLTETAAVQVADGDGAPAVVEAAAAALTAKGFASAPRAEGAAAELAADAAEARRAADAAASVSSLVLAWALVALCCTHHAGHLLHELGLHGAAHAPLMAAMGSVPVSAALGAFALLGPGRRLVTDGFVSLARGAPNMNSLVGLGSTTSFTVGAVCALLPGLGLDAAGFMEEPVMLLAFVLLGRAMEARAKVKAASDLKALAQLTPPTSRLVLDPTGAATAAAGGGDGADDGGCDLLPSGAEVLQVPTPSVRMGDVVLVLPGERVPVDGVVLAGTCSVDESMLTGESVWVPKRPGVAVCGGSIAHEAPITVRATATGAQSTLAGIARLVSEAQSREAPVQRLADAVAGRLCYGVMAASAATLAFWATVGTHTFPSALDAAPAGASAAAAPLLLAVRLAVDVLVVACPCALGLATPTAVLVASSMGATQGLLLRGGDVLERLAGVTRVVLDKTGTLTRGTLRLTGVCLTPAAAGGDGGADAEGRLLALAAAVEAATRHPLADAVGAAARARALALPSVSSSATVPGSGVSGVVGEQRVLVGRRDWVLSQLPPSAAAEAAAAAAQQSAQRTQVWVAAGGQLLGCLAFEDELRPDAAATVAALRRRGVAVHILSGDDPAVVATAAAAAGVDPSLARGGLTPAGKLAAIRQLQAEGGVVAMVGDGVNDAPALAAADVGIALKGGLDVAGEAASVVLMGDRLAQVLDALSLGRAALSKIRANLVWALAYNLVGLPLAAGAALPAAGIALTPSFAGGMMALSSVAVVSNSLALRAQWRPGGDARLRGAGGGGDAAAAGGTSAGGVEARRLTV